MADLSNYTPIYIRTTGNDTTGNGSSGSPYATAQKGYDIAVATVSGNYVLDFGVGNFSGVLLSQDWPSRISIRGVNRLQTFLGNINGNGQDAVQDYENNTIISPATSGYTINIISNTTIDLGSIISNGGNANGYFDVGNAGNITLDDVICGDITSVGGGSSGATSSGGTIIVANSVCGDINSNGGYGDSGGGGGTVIITNTNSENINSNGGQGLAGGVGYGGPGGSVTLTDSTSGDISASADSAAVGGDGSVTLTGSTIIPNIISGASVTTTNLKKGRGVNGSSILGLV